MVGLKAIKELRELEAIEEKKTIQLEEQCKMAVDMARNSIDPRLKTEKGKLQEITANIISEAKEKARSDSVKLYSESKKEIAEMEKRYLKNQGKAVEFALAKLFEDV